MNITKFRLFQLSVLTLVILLFGCNLFGDTNPNLETIVPKEEGMSAWKLSPQGDKLFYWVSSSSSYVLLDSTTQQKRNLDVPCKYSGWLDNTLLWCIDVNDQGSIIPADDFAAIPLQQVDEKETDVAELLRGKTIYEITYGIGEPKQILFALNADYKHQPDENYQIMIEDGDKSWQAYRPISIPLEVPKRKNEKVYSPNGDFYYMYVIRSGSIKEPTDFIEIYRSDENELLTGYGIHEPNYIKIGGWANDNSGVYFSEEPGGMYNQPGSVLYKLNVP
jgi:hypothetical protein